MLICQEVWKSDILFCYLLLQMPALVRRPCFAVRLYCLWESFWSIHPLCVLAFISCCFSSWSVMVKDDKTTSWLLAGFTVQVGNWHKPLPSPGPGKVAVARNSSISTALGGGWEAAEPRQLLMEPLGMWPLAQNLCPPPSLPGDLKALEDEGDQASKGTTQVFISMQLSYRGPFWKKVS